MFNVIYQVSIRMVLTLSTRIPPSVSSCCCPTGLMKPTLLKRFFSPEMMPRLAVVLPTCCLPREGTGARKGREEWRSE